MNRNWLRLLTFTGYWDQNSKLSWYPNAWAYFDAYALYTDPNDGFWAPLVQQHPDWILRDTNGNPVYINWGCNGATCPQYAANITNPSGYRAFWISQAKLYLQRSLPYRGLFIDDVNLDLTRVSDASGNPVSPVDPNTGRAMTNAAWMSYFADYMSQVRATFPGAEFVHNSLWFLDWTDPNVQREIQAADWINLERGVNDPGLTGGTGYWSLDRLFSFIDSVHANGKGVILDGEAWVGSDSDTAREYSVACYLLISTGSDMVGDTSQTPSHWWNGFTTDLGKAQSGRYWWQNLLRRDFAGGIALVNPPGSNPVVVTLPGPFIRVDGSVVNSITLNSSNGAVLLAPAHLSSLQCAPSELSSGAASSCTVTLQAAAPIGGAAVSVSKTNSLLSTPVSVTVPAGLTSAGFVVAVGSTLYTQTGSVTATLNGGSVTSRLGLVGSAGFAPSPSCQVSSATGTPKIMSFTIQDRNVGLASIVAATSTNTEVRIPFFAAGTTSPIIVTATQLDQGMISRADFQATNMTGGITTCGSSVESPHWIRLANNASGGVVVAANNNGRLQGFFRGTDRALWTAAQTAPTGPWSPVQSLGGVINGEPAIGVNADGRLEVFVLGSDNSLWHIWQTSPGGAWSSWSGLGGKLISNPSVARNQDGRLEVFALGVDRSLWHVWQTSPGRAWSAWRSLQGKLAGNPAVVANQDGRLEVFAADADGRLCHIAQVGANSDWSGWQTLNGNLVGDPVPVVNRDGRLEVFVRGRDQALWHMWQVTTGGAWSSYDSLGGIITTNPAVLNNGDGRLDAFVRGADNAVWYTTQIAPNSAWAYWASLGGAAMEVVSCGQNADGRLAVFTRRSDSTLWYIEQAAPGSWN